MRRSGRPRARRRPRTPSSRFSPDVWTIRQTYAVGLDLVRSGVPSKALAPPLLLLPVRLVRSASFPESTRVVGYFRWTAIRQRFPGIRARPDHAARPWNG